jgi:hypothetical protein
MNLNIKVALTGIIQSIHALDKKEFDKYLLISIASLLLGVGASIYYVYNTCHSLETDIIRLQATKKKTRRLLTDYANIMAEEARLQAILDQHKNFNLKVYFEQFCKEQSFSAAPGWDVTTNSINPQVDEITLTATFKGLSTENLVKMLQEYDKTEIVYIKNLRVKTEKDKKITCEIALATVKTKAQG